MGSNLGILAGDGPLPRQVAEAARRDGREVFVIAFEGQTAPGWVEGFPHEWIRLGAIGRTLDALKAAAVADVCMIGPIRRPSLGELRPDWRGAKLIARNGFVGLGDDALLKAVAGILGEAGMRIVGAHEILGDLLMPSGVLTRTRPDEDARNDIGKGLAAVDVLGGLDIGQAVVVQEGIVLAVEAAEGTDAMLSRCRDLHREGKGGVLVKTAKPQQDRRLDLPTIGVATVENAARAGLRGIAARAGNALISDMAGTVAAADRHGLFLVGVEEDRP
ncbi:UDP-2,3-diacylglucosamine diphosphatase LpxI [Inquilinus sp. CAU 1745]|uniref:LpxI family protein n=1 Tax=Inquilinus sp. CAU 1745 TaxID=3140369 RepID=UPI00325C0DB0